MDTSYLTKLETLFMALADKTRLRLLNLMRDDEVCVCFFTEVLGDSQPKISRHLAYLRNAGIVEARRDGKWMHYSINWPEDSGLRKIFSEVLESLGDRPEMRADREKYKNVCCSPELLVQIARTPIDFISPQANMIERMPAASHNELDEFLL
jgi:ArsR family transcriptional regulator